ncbi:MAG TPA: hypothetical protein VGH49_04620 [Xanthobacteraceae bacterium]|jgi:uncharacterized membrane protein
MSGPPNISQPTPHFDRFCILFLAAEWILFGSMHFSFHEATVRQIPEWIPARSTLVVVTGILEVTTGMLILLPGPRKWAALSSLILLALLLPAVYQILADDSSIEGPRAWGILFRVLLLPNNIAMALCSLHLWQHPGTTPARAAEILDAMLANRRPLLRSRARSADALVPRWPTSHQGATLLVAFLLLAANCAGFLVILASAISDHATAYLWAMMCIAIGAFIGFLFAVPRLNPGAIKGASLLPNTNIEHVSDWLSKIIVGVGLINLRQIGEFIDTQSSQLAASLGSPAPFAMALILYFFIDGLIQGYLLTRMFLAWQFALQMQNPAAGKQGRPADE